MAEIRGRAALVLLLLTGVGLACFGGGPEARGDAAYAENQFESALAEYRLALAQGSSPTLLTKAGQAALRAGDLEEAAEHFVKLATTSEEHVDFAADGLERVATRAVDTGNRAALQAALTGLTSLEAGRAIGSFARELAASLGESPRSQEALEILPAAAVASFGVGGMDSLIYVYATALRRLGRCQAAAPVFESLLRRGRLPEYEADLRDHGSYCALRVAQTTLERGLAEEARPWFERAIALRGPESNRRAAYLGLGDSLVEMNDILGARQAYEEARRGLILTDPLYGVILRRLNRLVDAGTVIR